MKIYEGNSKAWDFLIVSLTDIPFGIVRKCDENSHDALKSLINKYEVSDEKQDILNELTNKWNICKIRDTSPDPEIWCNELYTLNLRVKKIKENYEKDEYELKA